MFNLKVLALGGLAASVSAECSRAFLKEATDAYVQAQTLGSAGLPNISAKLNYTENDRATDIKSGVLKEAIKIDFTRSVHDTVNCATFTEIIAATNPHQYVIGTRMEFQGENSSISLMESIVTDKGDWAFNATGYLYWNSIETSWDPIPEDKRDSREVIKAAGNAYFDRWNDTGVRIPLGTPCARLEGGAYTGARDLAGNTCNLGGFPSTIVVTNRRYVVDETMGVVVIFMGFPGLDRANPRSPMPDSHMFRVQNGLVRYIHTVSACWQDGCGMNGTGIPQFRL